MNIECNASENYDANIIRNSFKNSMNDSMFEKLIIDNVSDDEFSQRYKDRIIDLDEEIIIIDDNENFEDSGFDEVNIYGVITNDRSVSMETEQIIEAQIEKNEFLNADAMEEFIKIVNNETEFKMQSTHNLKSRIESNKYKQRLLIKMMYKFFFCGPDSAKDIGHWICIFYDSKKNQVLVYDSLFEKNERIEQSSYWESIHDKAVQRLYP